MICHNEKGQSTVEFLLSFSLAIGFLISFYKLATVFTNGYLVHYATFQASRAYMVGDEGRNTPAGSDAFAEKQARDVFNYFKLSSLIADFDAAVRINDPETNAGNTTNLYVGVKVDFQDSLLVPGTAKKIEIPLRSESYLGLEPTRAECFARICDAMESIGVRCRAHVTVSDNGC